MYCKNCGQPLPEHAKFCSHCGTPISAANRPASGPRPGPTPAARRERPAWNFSTDSGALRARMIPVICAALSLLLLLTNWMTVTGEARTFLNDLKYEADGVVSEIDSTLSYFDLEVNTRSIYDVINIVSRGAVTPVEMFSLSTKIIPLLADVAPYVKLIDDTSVAMIYFLIALLVIYIIILLVNILSGIDTIIVRARGKQTKINLLFFVMQLLLLLVFTALCLILRSEDIGLPVRPTLTALAAVVLAGFSGQRKLKSPEK